METRAKWQIYDDQKAATSSLFHAQSECRLGKREECFALVWSGRVVLGQKGERGGGLV
jgi:hypothetical protein